MARFEKGHIPWTKGRKVRTNNALLDWVKNGGKLTKEQVTKRSEKIAEKLRGRVVPLSVREKIRSARLGRVSSLETRKRQSEAQRGERGSNYRGGLTKENKIIRNSLEYRLWRSSVFERDKFKCVWCGNGGYLEADHIKPFSLFPELRFAIDNGRTLCQPCHRKTDTWGRRMLGFKK